MIQVKQANNKLKADSNGADRRYMRQFAQENGTTESEEVMLTIMALCYARLTENSRERIKNKIIETDNK